MAKAPMNKASSQPAGAQMNALRDLVARADLETVDTVQLSAERLYVDRVHGGPLSQPDVLQIEIGAPTVRYPTAPEATGAAILVELAVEWRGVNGVAYGRAALTMRVAYRFAGLEQAPLPATLAEFANELGLHHAWPFLRERLRTLSAELGLPPAVLPLRKR